MDKFLKKPKVLLVILILIPLFVGWLGSIGMSNSLENWYIFLNRPEFTPPDYVFGPVWTILYILMGYSLWRITQSKKTSGKASAYKLFGLQLLFNGIWTILFFTIRQPLIALLDLQLLLITLFVMLMRFYRIDRIACLCNIPYFAWTFFAVYLNSAFVLLN